ncbi:MAG: hypothetical protein COT14_00445 [Candidatus Diapherotrites archaeon CG08_land_8_20_14_0_20_30_16]|nr:MAG: hypothetical protein COT14_00445 [Candidatus Diapherotrites archaeon CG08_land_8_20_14_0_20_30_16]
MLFARLSYLVLGFLLVLDVASAGYAVTYSHNAFGYGENSTYVTVDVTKHTLGYTDYPSYNATSSYYYGGYYNGYYNNYYTPYNGCYYYYNTYYCYPAQQAIVNYAPYYPTYVAVRPVYNPYVFGWYYY